MKKIIQDITKTNNSIEPSKNNELNEFWVISELEKNIIIKQYGSLDTYLSMKLLDVIENAIAPDHKWELHIDYRTRLRSVETILKLKDKNFWWGWVHLNFFTSPKQLKH